VQHVTRLIYDLKFRAILYQIMAVSGVIFVGWYLYSNVVTNLADKNIATGFAYMQREAGFNISTSLIPYQSSDSYGRALLVGLLNTFHVSLLAIVIATVLGLVVGVARLSSNPLLARLMLLYVEFLRNVPLLLQLFLWYSIIIFTLPNVRQAMQPIPYVFLSNSGLVIPSLNWSLAKTGVLACFVIGLIGALLVRRAGIARRIQTGIERPLWPILLAAIAVPTALALLVLQPEWTVSWPEAGRFRLTGGSTLTPEFTALLVGLSLNASSSIAEIVRSGIQAVKKGQWEAAQALGLQRREVLSKVVLPQGLRVMIPPMTSQYLSLFKNSSLSVAIGYPDLVMVSTTTMNQTGQAIEGIAIFMTLYLSISIAISILMNWYNGRVALKER
jgi:general L-amino acid transport system permease protein